MKYSIYNTYIELNDRVGVIYNSRLDSAIFATKKLHSNISLGNYDALDEKIISTAFVNDDIDEYQLYLDEMLTYENDNRSYHLMINPTLDCIFNCWYCYEHHTKGYMNSEVIGRIYHLIDSIANNYDSLTISFFGGEPLMYYTKVIIPIVSYTHKLFESLNKRFHFNMTTNGYLFNMNRVSELKNFGFSGSQITLDGNRDKHNRIRFLKGGLPSYDNIIDNIKLLASNGCSTIVRLNCTHDNVESFQSLTETLKNLDEESLQNITIDCHIVWQEDDKEGLQKKQHKLVAHFTHSNLKANKMDFRQPCYADRRSQCLINYNGDVYKCTAVDFENVQRDGYIDKNGNIVWENDSLEKRMQSKLRNKRCKSCNILPLCHGGCSSRSLESSDYCLYPKESQKQQLVINRLEHLISVKHEN